MKKHCGVVWPLIVHFDRDRFATIGTGCFDAAVSMQRAEYAEGIPSAVGVPPAVGSVNTVAGWRSREWIDHPDLGRGGVENERVRIMEAAPPLPHFVIRRSRQACDLGSCRSLAQLNKLSICKVPEIDVELVHWPIVTLDELTAFPLRGTATC